MIAAVADRTPPAAPPAHLAADEARHQRLAAEAIAVSGVPAVDFYRTLTIRQLESVTWDLVPEGDDEAIIAGGDPQALRLLRLWHAAWVALEEKECRQDQRRRAREARAFGAPATIGGGR